MWRATGRARGGQSAEVPFLEIDDVRSREELLAHVRRFLKGRHQGTMATLTRELESPDPLPGVDLIENWGGKALELIGAPQYGSGLEFESRATTDRGVRLPGLTWISPAEEPTHAFHLPEAIVADVTGLESMEIEGTALLTGAPGRSETRLEWRAYLGDNTLVSENDAVFEDVVTPAGRLRRATIWLQNKAGMLVGRILHVMGKPPSLPFDRFFHGRLKHFEDRHPDIATTHPDLRLWARMPILHQAPPRGTVVVFVHGTFSCCIPSLVAAGPFRSPTYRFEHDTFRPITDNADELVQAVNRLLQPAPLYLVAHSRGGLVARLAARRLSQDCPVRVLTYGTPHLGTPLANAGTRAWSALLAMGRSAAGAFAWDPASLAGKVLMRPRELPPGLAVMRTDSETLRSWAFLAEPFDLVSCGAAYDEAALPDGRSAYTFGQRVLHESFGGVPNDLVVPTASALGAGTAQQLDGSCDHFSYFSRREVQEALRGL